MKIYVKEPVERIERGKNISIGVLTYFQYKDVTHVLLKCSKDYISLTHPNLFWEHDELADTKLKLVKKGTELTIKV